MWLTYILTSAVILSFFDLSRKASIRDNPIWQVLMWSNFVGALFMAALAYFTGTLNSALAVSLHDWALILAKAFLVTIEWSCTFYALRSLPISSCMPVHASSPLWTLLAAMVVFHEIPTLRQGAGMLVIFTGYYIFAMAGRAEGVNIFRTKGIAFCFTGVFFGAMSAVYDKYLLQTCAIDRSVMQFWFSADMFVLAAVIATALRLSPLPKRKLSWRWTIPCIGIFLVISDWFYFRAVAEPGAMISVTALLRRLNVAVSFMIGVWIFHEKHVRAKAYALIAILAGAVLLLI